MVLRVHNANASTQTRYLPFTIPLGYVSANSLTDYILLGNGATACKQWDDGQDAIYVASAAWATGTNTHTLAADGSPPDPIFSLHPAYGEAVCGTVTQLTLGVVPQVYASLPGGDVLINPTMRGSTPTWRIDGNQMKQAVWEEHFDGWHVWHAVTFYSDQAIADVYTSVMWSDDTYSAGWSRPCTSITWNYGHEVSLKFAANEGFTRSGGLNNVISLPMTFANGPLLGPNYRDSWAGNIWNGRHLAVRGWMFGRGSATIPGDETSFGVCDYLDANCSATEWEGYWQHSGSVGTVPTHTDVVRPNYAETDKHYVTWDRGFGGSDPVGSVGLCFSTYANALGLQGALGLCAGGAVIHGYQRLYDYEAGMVDWALRPHWVKRDGTYQVLSGNIGERFCLSGQEPHINSGRSFTDINWGRAPLDAGFDLPNHADGNQDGFDGQHRTSTTLTAYYQLAKYDYFAYRLILDWADTESHNQRRGGIYSIGSAMSGDREPVRSAYSVLNAAAACPEVWPKVRDLIMNPNGSYLTSCLEREECQLRPPEGTIAQGFSWWTFVSGTTTYTTTNGITLNGDVDVGFTALGAQGLYAMWKLSGDTRMRDLAFAVATTAFRDGSLYCPVGEPASDTNGGAATTAGWTLPYDMRVNWAFNSTDLATFGRGRPTSDAQRTFGSADFGPTHSTYTNTKIVKSIGGVAIRRWCVGAAELFSRVHPDSAVRARARNVYLTACEGTTTPYGWLHSYFIASAQLT